tara:strand:- start:475 stop:999 length:525 start_codon:yes stop_codon:yes gene_type:complete
MKATNIKDFLIVKDNFFEEKVYNQILYDISRLKFESRYNTSKEEDKNIYQKIYFNVPLNKNHFAVEEVFKILSEYGLDLVSAEHNYFLSTKHKEASPHTDHSDINCLVYLKGINILNSGTGFYQKENNELVLNRHIGFKENRALIFDSKIHHTSLQFNEVTATRYVMANFFNYK